MPVSRKSLNVQILELYILKVGVWVLCLLRYIITLYSASVISLSESFSMFIACLLNLRSELLSIIYFIKFKDQMENVWK